MIYFEDFFQQWICNTWLGSGFCSIKHVKITICDTAVTVCYMTCNLNMEWWKIFQGDQKCEESVLALAFSCTAYNFSILQSTCYFLSFIKRHMPCVAHYMCGCGRGIAVLLQYCGVAKLVLQNELWDTQASILTLSSPHSSDLAGLWQWDSMHMAPQSNHQISLCVY